MFQDKLSTLIIRCIKSDKFWQTNEFLDLDDFVVKKARTGRGHTGDAGDASPPPDLKRC